MPERRYHSTLHALPPSLGYLMQQGVTDLIATCGNCHNVAVVAVETIIGKLGPERLVPDVKGRCSICGSRDCDIRPDYSASSPGLIANHGASL